MKYAIVDMKGERKMEIETSGNEVVGVTPLYPLPEGTAAPTPEQLQKEVSLYMRGQGKSIEDALAAYVGGYNSLERVDS